MISYLNQTVTNGELIAMFVTWQICDIASAAWKRCRKRSKAG